VVFVRAACLRDEINACVLCRDAELRCADFLGPIREEPHVGVDVGIAGLVAKVGADEFLEVAAFFALGLGGGAVLREDLLEGSYALVGANVTARSMMRCDQGEWLSDWLATTRTELPGSHGGGAYSRSH